jgi:hypothetical protein
MERFLKVLFLSHSKMSIDSKIIIILGLCIMLIMMLDDGGE